MRENLSKTRKLLFDIRSNKYFELSVISIIIMSALNIGLGTYNLNTTLINLFSISDYIITIFFLIEILIRMFSYEKTFHFFKKKWNIFDFSIVFLSLIPVEIFEAIIIGRLLRVFRLLRVVSFIPQFRILIESLATAVPRVSYVLLFIFIETYIFAAIGSIVFSEVDPVHWDNIGVSMLTLFKVATIDGWIEIMDMTLISFPHSWIFYLTYIIINSFIFLNMIVGVIIDVMIRQNNTAHTEEMAMLLVLKKKLENLELELNHLGSKNEHSSIKK